jgi:hypothetical protein
MRCSSRITSSSSEIYLTDQSVIMPYQISTSNRTCRTRMKNTRIVAKTVLYVDDGLYPLRAGNTFDFFTDTRESSKS